jgi:hypothetical protein
LLSRKLDGLAKAVLGRGRVVTGAPQLPRTRYNSASAHRSSVSATRRSASARWPSPRSRSFAWPSASASNVRK